MFKKRPTRAEIDLSALSHNYSVLKAGAGSAVSVMPVIKADAYGHGAVAVAQCLTVLGVPGFAVATVAEAWELKSAGIKDDILVLGTLYEDDLEHIIAGGIIPVLWDEDSARKLSVFASGRGETVAVQVKIDTGMGRAGIPVDGASGFISTIKKLSGLKLVGLLSHLAIADSEQEWAQNYTENQAREFVAVCEASACISPSGNALTFHLANSAGIVRYDFPVCNMARVGIALYGAYPDPGLYEKINLKPVMSVKTGIVLLKNLKPGQSVSYGCTYTAHEDIIVALLPIGYADGLSRLLSGCGEVLLRGVRVPIIGRVCMDWIMIDVSDVGDVAVGDEVVILGTQGEESISVDELAETLGTISYEIFCSWSVRVRREYI
ncbi:alanine racemase [bacterium]|nr:alanine racemase [bacterium]